MKIKISLLLFLFVVSLTGTIDWTQKTDMPTGRDGLGIGVVNDTVYCIGGWTAGNPNTATGIVKAYDPISDSWTTKTSMPTPRGFLAVCVLNNKIYALGGWNATSNGLTTAEVYDPASDTSGGTPWQTGASILTPRYHPEAGALYGVIYVCGGLADSDLICGDSKESRPDVAVVESYDTPTDNWRTENPMLAARRELDIGVVGTNLYAIGGWPVSVSSRNEEGFVIPGITEGDAKTVYSGHDFTPTILTGALHLPKDMSCKIFDITGREVDAARLSRGIYFIEIDGHITNKIIKIR